MSFADCFSESVDLDLPSSEAGSLDSTKAADKPKIRARRNNTFVISVFTMAFKTFETMAFIDKGCTVDWPESLASEVVKALNCEYSPKDAMAGLEMWNALKKISMKAKEIPKKLFIQLFAIKVQYGKTLDFNKKLDVVLNAYPLEYKSVISSQPC